MVKFNPDIQATQSPDFRGYTRPISPVDADQTWGTLFKGIGNLFEEGVKGVDMIQKADIKRQQQPLVDAYRDAFTDHLLKGNVLLKGMPGVASGNSGGPDNEGSEEVELSGAQKVPPKVLPAGDPEKEPLPGALENLPNQVGNLKAAADAGKYTPTYYQMQLLNLAKSLRNQYPGQRDFIDAQIKHMTGMDPANSIVRSLLAENNQLQSRINNPAKQATTFLSPLIKEGNQEASKRLNAMNAGQISPAENIEWAASQKKDQWQWKQEKTGIDRYKGNREVLSDMTTDTFNGQAAQEAAKSFSSISFTFGNGQPQNVMDFLASGKELSPNEEPMVLRTIVGEKNRYIQAMKLKGNEGGPNGSAAFILGATKFQNIVDENVKLFDTAIKAITDKDYGTAHAAARFAQAKIDNKQRDLFKDVTTDDYLATLGALSKIGGNGPAGALVTQSFLTGTNGQSPFKDYTGWQRTKMTAQPNLQVGGTGIPYTLSNAVDDAKNKGIADSPGFSRDFSDYVRLTTGIADTRVPLGQRVNWMKASYDRGNLGFVSKIKEDGVDPNTGRPIPGRYAAYVRMTSLPVLQETFKASQSTGDAQLWQDAKNWTEHTFSRELFGTEMRDLNRITDRASMKITYDDQGHRFQVEPNRRPTLAPGGSTVYGIPRPAPTGSSFKVVQDSINKLNFGMQGIINLAKAEGKDPDEYLLKYFAQNEVDITKIGGTIPEMMGAAFMTSKLKAAGQSRARDKGLGTTAFPGNE